MAIDGPQWRDITEDDRVGTGTEIFDHSARIYIECACGEHFDWWNRTSEVHLCPQCRKPYRAFGQIIVETYE